MEGLRVKKLFRNWGALDLESRNGVQLISEINHGLCAGKNRWLAFCDGEDLFGYPEIPIRHLSVPIGSKSGHQQKMLILYVYTDPATVSFDPGTRSLSWLPRANIQKPPTHMLHYFQHVIHGFFNCSFTMAHLLFRQAELPDVTSCSLSIWKIIKLTRSMNVSTLRHQWHRLS